MFAFPAAIEESGENLGQLLTVLESQDEAILGATDTLAATQGAGDEAAEDEDQGWPPHSSCWGPPPS